MVERATDAPAQTCMLMCSERALRRCKSDVVNQSSHKRVQVHVQHDKQRKQLQKYKARQAERETKLKEAEVGESSAAAAAASVENEQASSPKKVDEIYNTWEDTEDTTLMWSLISNNQVEELGMWLEEDPTVAFIRSRDGRGPMW